MGQSALGSGAGRRRFLKAGAALGAATVAFPALAERGLFGARKPGAGGACGSTAYGPVQPVRDLATGLFLLALPAGFEYRSFGWTGERMDDGRATPARPDGMAVVAQRGDNIVLVRNHELSAGQGTQCRVPGGMYNPKEFGGTTTLVFDLRRGGPVRSYTSLGGTIRNCAGGPTPWGSWISCEETFHRWNDRADGFNHGYVFEVPADGASDGRPVRAAGRFAHEAVAIDSGTGVMYQTEDDKPAGFYRYLPPSGGAGQLRDGGQLQAMVVDGVPRRDLRGGFDAGTRFPVRWQSVADPEGRAGRAYDSVPDAAMFSRLEGCWADGGRICFVSTDGGAAGLGQVWAFSPGESVLTLLYESRDEEDVDGPDNIAISPRGGIVLCEDGGSDPKRLIGLDRRGETFVFAENRIALETADIGVIDGAFPGARRTFRDHWQRDFRDQEWAGACFFGEWLFANVQTPGVTFAIRGPWAQGSL